MKTSCIDHIKVNSIVSYNLPDIYNAFAEHFALIGKNLAQKFPHQKMNLHDYINKIPRLVHILYLNQMTKWEVKKLKQFSNKTSLGYDNINDV